MPRVFYNRHHYNRHDSRSNDSNQDGTPQQEDPLFGPNGNHHTTTKHTRGFRNGMRNNGTSNINGRISNSSLKANGQHGRGYGMRNNGTSNNNGRIDNGALNSNGQPSQGNVIRGRANNRGITANRPAKSKGNGIVSGDSHSKSANNDDNIKEINGDKTHTDSKKVDNTLKETVDSVFPVAFYCHMCNIRDFSEIKDYLHHLETPFHAEVAQAFHVKSATILQLLRDEAHLASVRSMLIQQQKNKKVPITQCHLCKCKVYGKTQKHLKSSEHLLVSSYVNPSCCGKSFSNRNSFEEHKLSLPHLRKESEIENIKSRKEEQSNTGINCKEDSSKKPDDEIRSNLATFINGECEYSPQAIPLYDPGVALGKVYIEHIPQFKCRPCRQFIHLDENLLETHCRSHKHYQKLVNFIRQQDYNKKKKIKKDSSNITTEISRMRNLTLEEQVDQDISNGDKVINGHKSETNGDQKNSHVDTDSSEDSSENHYSEKSNTDHNSETVEVHENGHVGSDSSEDCSVNRHDKKSDTHHTRETVEGHENGHICTDSSEDVDVGSNDEIVEYDTTCRDSADGYSDCNNKENSNNDEIGETLDDQNTIHVDTDSLEDNNVCHNEDKNSNGNMDKTVECNENGSAGTDSSEHNDGGHTDDIKENISSTNSDESK